MTTAAENTDGNPAAQASVAPEPPAEQPVPPASLRKSILKVVLLCGVLISCLLVIHLTPFGEWFKDVSEMRTRLQEVGGWAAPLVFCGAAVVLVAVGVPRLALCWVGGMAFGFAWGLFWAHLGTLIGSYATFLFARWAGRDFALRYRPRMGKFGAMLDSPSVTGIILLRLMPITAVIVNLTLGISSVRHSRFLIATAIGTLPEGVAVTLLASGLVKGSVEQATGYITAAGVLLIVIWAGTAFWTRRLRASEQSGSK